MRQIVKIVIREMVAGRNVYEAEQISVPWDNRSFWLNDNVEFHIILSEQNDEGEEVRRDITNEYIIDVPKMQGKVLGNDGNIVFKDVKVTYSKKVHLRFEKEH